MITSAVLVLAALAQTWGELGGSATGDGVSIGEVGYTPSLSVDFSGRPTVAWMGGQGNARDMGWYHLRRWSATAWVELDGSATAGGIGLGLGSSAYPAVVASGGNLVVAWEEFIPTTSSPNWEIYL